MAILVLDTSVIFDLERGGLLEAAFSLDYTFVAPDLLYRNELESDPVGPQLIELGLEIVELDGTEVEAAQAVARERKGLSRPDCWAMVCARREGYRLVCGDARLRGYAESEAIECSGLLWILDRICDAELLTPETLVQALTRIRKHGRARLPKDEVENRLAKWAAASGQTRERAPRAYANIPQKAK